ncbi:ALDH-like protein [Pyrenochaeta sp. DS3sAY3a]|nr:ALDH-like protein [Pyrenochaeta sp. DS3sAY3a]
MTSPDVYQTIDPTSEKVLHTFPLACNEDVLQALDAAHECYQNVWRNMSFAQRGEVVSKAATLLEEQSEKHAQLITMETGKLIDQARWEISVCVDILGHYAAHAEEFLAPVERECGGALVVSEPLGVILAIEPWNFPYYQLARVAGPQLMAGNVVVAKSAPSTPQCGLGFADLFAQAGAPAGVYTNLLCSVDQVGMLIDDFRVRGVTLTGSERAGAAVAERAGRQLKKVVLELGGSDPFLVLEDAAMDTAIEAAVQGRMLCMGQACAAAKRFIVVGEQRAREFADGLVARLQRFAPGEPTLSQTSLGPIASARALELLLAQIDEAQKHGGRVVAGGKRIPRPGFYLEPTVIANITPENPLFQQETFGPIFSLYTAHSEDHAVQIANATQFGLGATVYCADDGHAEQIARRLECGMVFVNSGVSTTSELPFGGVKNSGFGRELGGQLGIIEFVNRKVIRTPGKAQANI